MHCTAVRPSILKSLWFLPVCLALALAACSSSDDSGSSGSGGGDDSTSAQPTSATDNGGGSGDYDACSILTPEDVQAEIGTAPEPNGAPVGPFSSCGYFDTATNFVQFQICDCLPGSQFNDSAKSAAEALETEVKPVDGVGDKAYWYAGLLWVQKGDAAFNLWISKAGYYAADGSALEGDALEAVSLPDEKALALKLLDRLN